MTTATLLLVQVRVEPQNGWLWMVMGAVLLALLFFATVGWLHYRSGNRELPPTPPTEPQL
jgi:hypothetical protein